MLQLLKLPGGCRDSPSYTTYSMYCSNGTLCSQSTQSSRSRGAVGIAYGARPPGGVVEEHTHCALPLEREALHHLCDKIVQLKEIIVNLGVRGWIEADCIDCDHTYHRACDLLVASFRDNYRE